MNAAQREYLIDLIGSDNPDRALRHREYASRYKRKKKQKQKAVEASPYRTDAIPLQDVAPMTLSDKERYQRMRRIKRGDDKIKDLINI